MRILGFMLENFMRVRLVEITPHGRVTIISGKNSQGKTSVMKGFFATLLGRKATPDEPVRKGSARATGKILIGDSERQLLITRVINKDRTQQLRVEPARNGHPTGASPYASPQEVLNDLVGEMAEDPVAFVALGTTKEGVRKQIEILRKVAKVGIDFEQINADIAQDTLKRTDVSLTVRRLEGEVSAIVVQPTLPQHKIDERAILQELEGASGENKKIEEIRAAKSKLGFDAQEASRVARAAADNVARQLSEIELIKGRLNQAETDWEAAKEQLEIATNKAGDARDAFDRAPEPDFVDVSAVSARLQEAQVVNREIDKRNRRAVIEKQLSDERRMESQLTRAIDDRKEEKARALAAAQMPVAGLLFDEERVTFNGIPLDQLGEAEQLRVSAEIMMASAPKLRVLPIWRGEALDDENLVMLGELAEKHDFYVLMLKVDSTGTCGIVMEDGEVKIVNENG